MKSQQPAKADEQPAPRRKRGGYRPWAELLRRTFAIDVLECPACKGRIKLVAMIALDAAAGGRRLGEARACGLSCSR